MATHLSAAPINVLFVEDNNVNRRVILKQLELLQCNVTAVINGLEAVQFCRNHRVDIILMDCLMPVMDGYEATRQIRQDPLGKNKSVAIIGITAHSFTSDRRRYVEVGMNDFLIKPVFLKELSAAIAKWSKPVAV